MKQKKGKVRMMQRIEFEGGFSLIELIVVMGLLGIVLALATTNFTTLLGSLKGESKIAETETETIVGLEILRQDIENAGYGLPWHVNDINGDGNFSNDWGFLNDYVEADSVTVCNTTNNISAYNDGSTNATHRRPPRAILSGNNVCSDGSDYLVIKSTVVRNEDESQKWTYLWNNGASISVNSWPSSSENMAGTTKIIAINPKQNKIDNVLMTYGASNSFYSQVSSATTNYSPRPSEVYLLFGVGPDNQLRMPFNRADYYISRNNPPSRCANGTGVLEKATLNHADGRLGDYSPLLDCVADMQVVYGLGPSAGEAVSCYTNDIFGLDAQAIRERVKEVRVYILAHEGQMDRNYRFGNNIVRVGDGGGLPGCDPITDIVLGRDFDLSGIANYQNYRWKVYTLVILPDNLKGR